MSHPFTLSPGASASKQPSVPAAPPSPASDHSPRPKRWHPSTDPVDVMPLSGTTSKTNLEGSPSSKQWEIPPWYKVLKWSHSEAFSWDTSLMREARKEYFKKHSPNFTMDGTHGLSEVFRHIAKSAKLLGSAIYEIQEVLEGPDELWQANYALKSLPKGLKFLQAVPPSEFPKVMGLVGIHDQEALCHFKWHDSLPLLQEGGPEWVDSHQPPLNGALQAWPGVWKMLQIPINLIRHSLLPQPAEPSTLRGGRPQQVSLIRVTVSRRHPDLIRNQNRGVEGNLTSPRVPYWGHPPPISTALEGNQMEKAPPTNPQCPITCFPAHCDQAATHHSGITQDICQQYWT